MTALSLHGLVKSFPSATHPALNGLDLSVESGALTALLGPSGCGKTTTMKLVAGLIQPDAGDIRLDGQSILSLPPERRDVAMVFQNPLLFPHLTVAGNIGFGLRMRGIGPRKIAEAVEEILVRVRLQGLGDRFPTALSGGQQQRAALARALILRPKVLLLDEPLSNLDAGLRDEMRSLIRTLQRDTGITTLVVTHDQAEAVAIADRIALILGGRVAQHGPPQEFYQRPLSLAVARFFGGVNFLPGKVAGGTFQSALGALPLPFDHADGPGILTIRPEALRLGTGPAAMMAKVVDSSFLGTQSRVGVSIAGIRLEALVAPETARALAPGTGIGVTLPPDALWILPPDQAGVSPDISTA